MKNKEFFPICTLYPVSVFTIVLFLCALSGNAGIPPDNLTVDAGSDRTVEPNGQTVLISTVEGGTTPYTYSWTLSTSDCSYTYNTFSPTIPTGSFIDNTDSEADAIYEASDHVEGVVTITLTVTDDEEEQVSDTVRVTIDDILPPTFSQVHNVVDIDDSIKWPKTCAEMREDGTLYVQWSHYYTGLDLEAVISYYNGSTWCEPIKLYNLGSGGSAAEFAGDICRISNNRVHVLYETYTGGMLRSRVHGSGGWTGYYWSYDGCYGEQSAMTFLPDDTCYMVFRNWDGDIKFYTGLWSELDDAYTGSSTSVIPCIDHDSEGNIWVAYQHGSIYVRKYSGSSWGSEITASTAGTLNSILVDESDNLWVAYDNGSCYTKVYDGSSWGSAKEIDASSDNAKLALDEYGDVWAIYNKSYNLYENKYNTSTSSWGTVKQLTVSDLYEEKPDFSFQAWPKGVTSWRHYITGTPSYYQVCAREKRAVLEIDNDSEATTNSQVTLTFDIADTIDAQMYIDGDVENGANVRQWIAYSTPQNVTLTSGLESKTIKAKFKDHDSCGNESYWVEKEIEYVPYVYVSPATQNVNESAGSVNVNVYISSSPANTVTVDFATTDITATASQDYITTNGTITFEPSGATTKTISITIINDSDYESNETFKFTLSNVNEYALLSEQNEQIITILDNDYDVSVQDLTGTQYDDVTIYFTLKNANSYSTDITVHYRVNDQDDWHTCTAQTGSETEDLTTSPNGENHNFVWDSEADLPSENSTTMQIKITATSGGPNSDTTSEFTLHNNDTPSISDLTTPQGEQSGDVLVTYTLTDPDTSYLAIEAEYTTDSVSWNTATGSPKTNVEPGSGKNFTWNSSTDLSGFYGTNVKLRLRAKDTDDDYSDWAVTGIFTLDNNSTPSISIQTPTGVHKDPISVSYTLYDTESDLLSLTVKYSTDEENWYNATEGAGSDGTTNLTSSPSGVAHTYVWDFETDLGNVENTTAKIRMWCADNDESSSATTGWIELDNKAPTGVAPDLPEDETTEVSLNPTLQCTSGSDYHTPIQYNFRLAEDDEFTSGLQTRGWDAPTTWTPSTTLKEATVYYWQVKGKDNISNETNWADSDPWWFITEDYTSPTLSNLSVTDGLDTLYEQDLSSSSTLDETSYNLTFSVDCEDNNPLTEVTLYYRWNETGNYMTENMPFVDDNTCTCTIDSSVIGKDSSYLDYCYDPVGNYNFKRDIGQIPDRVDSKSEYGLALEFNNTSGINEYAKIPLKEPEDTGLKQPGDEFSIALWIYLRSNGQTEHHDFQSIIDGYAYELRQDHNDRHIEFWIRSTIDPEDPGEIVTTVLNSGETKLNLNTWHYIVGVRDNNTAYLYIDGDLVDSESISLPTIYVPVNHIMLANNYTFYDRPLDARIDDLIFIKSALSNSQIETLSKRECSENPSGTIARWKFNELVIDDTKADLQFEVKAEDSGENTDSTENYTIEIIDFPNTVSQKTPTNGAEIKSVTPDLVCNDANSAYKPIQYEFKLSDSSDFSTNLQTRSWDVSTTFSVPEQLYGNTTYYWQIRAKNNQGIITDWVIASPNTWTFKTDFITTSMLSIPHVTDLFQDHYEPELWMEPYQKLDDRMIYIYVDCKTLTSAPTVTINYKWDSGNWNEVEMTKQSGNTYYCTLNCSELTGTHEFHFYFFAWDDEGHGDVTDVFTVIVYDINPKIMILKPPDGAQITGN